MLKNLKQVKVMKKREMANLMFNTQINGDFRLNFKKIDCDLLEVELISTDYNQKVTVSIDEEYIYDIEGDILFDSIELYSFENFTELNTCPECKGKGYCVAFDEDGDAHKVECECDDYIAFPFLKE